MKEHQSSPPETGPTPRRPALARVRRSARRCAATRLVALDGRKRRSRGRRARSTWLHDVGVRGVQLFDGGMGGRWSSPSRCARDREAWDEAVDTAVRTASELGMELAVATSSGWSAAGGPWVVPDDAMKKVVWSERRQRRRAGRGRAAAAPRCRACTRTARVGALADGTGWATDWRVVAFPRDPAHERATPDPGRASAPIDDWSCLIDGSFGRTLALPRDPDGWSTAWVEQEFADPSRCARSWSGCLGRAASAPRRRASAVLQASDDGVAYRDVAELPPDAVPARTASFPAVTARAVPPRALGRERGRRAAAARRRRAPAARAPHDRHVPGLGVRAAHRWARPSRRGQGRLRRRRRLLRRADRTARRMSGRSIRRTSSTSPPRRDGGCAGIHPRATGPCSASAHRSPGRRTAPHSPTRRASRSTSSTASACARISTRISAGSAARRRRRIGRAPLRRAAQRQHRGRAAELDGRDPRALRAPRGYDPAPWLPALAGYLVGGAAASDRFLYDYRRTIAELLADEYYGTLAAEAHRRGMAYYAEALEDGRPQLGDDLAMRSHADVPMGAMWTFDPEQRPAPDVRRRPEGRRRRSPTSTASRGSARRRSRRFDRPWASTPRTLKHVADLQLALGVTRFCIHTSPHQPIAALPPGIALAPFLGQAFTVNETWSGSRARGSTTSRAARRC